MSILGTLNLCLSYIISTNYLATYGYFRNFIQQHICFDQIFGNSGMVILGTLSNKFMSKNLYVVILRSPGKVYDMYYIKLPNIIHFIIIILFCVCIYKKYNSYES